LKKSWPVVGLILLAVLAVAVAGFAVMRPLDKPPAPVPAAATYTPAPVEIKHAKVAVFVGDSLTVGSGVTQVPNRWSTLVSNYFGWGEVNLAQGGTGFVRTGAMESCKQTFCPAFPARVADIVKADPDVVVVLGGRNDAPLLTEDVYPAVKKFYSSLRKALPKTPIIAVSSFWDDDPTPESVPALNDVIKAEVTAVKGTFIDVGELYAGKPNLIGKDGVHPTDAGYALLAKTIETQIEKARIPGLVRS
jgi:lysophospholipase L1-like esterase